MPNRLLFLGTSDGVASPRRNHASILLTMGNTTVLLDCGEPCSHTMVKHGIPADLMDGLVISHMHSDHVGGFPMVVQWLWLANRTKNLPVYMPAEGIPTFQELLKTTYLFDELLQFQLSMKALRARRTFSVGELRFMAEPNHHLDSFRSSFQKKYHNRFESFSFRISGRGTSVVYSGDVASPNDLENLLRPRTNVLIVELAHMQPESLFQFLADHEIDRIILTHLGAHIQIAIPRTKQLCSRYFPKNKVIFASDGMTVDF